MRKITSTKAVAGGVAANVITVALYAISLIPGWTNLPEAPKGALVALLTGAIGYAIVYFSPANATVAVE